MEAQIKKSLRSAKNFTKGYSETQIKVRDATSNDPAGASGHLMADIASLSYNHRDFIEIMEMIDKRLNDHGKNWRHVFKALTLLDYLLACGSEQVINYARDNLYVVRTLKEFQYIDEFGRDQGSNVRLKSKELTLLLADDVALKERRGGRGEGHGRVGFNSEQEFTGLNQGFASQLDAQTGGSRVSHGPSGSGGNNEDDDIKRALELSKQTAAEEEKKRQRYETSDRELQRALDESRTDLVGSQSGVLISAADEPPQKQNADLFFNSLDNAPQYSGISYQHHLMIDQGQQVNHNDQVFANNQLMLQQQQPVYAGSFNPFDQGNGQYHGHTPIGFDGNNPNARMAEISRGAPAVDPFAAMAHQKMANTNNQPAYEPLPNSFSNIPSNLVQLSGPQVSQSPNPAQNPNAKGIVFSKGNSDVAQSRNPFASSVANSGGANNQNVSLNDLQRRQAQHQQTSNSPFLGQLNAGTSGNFSYYPSNSVGSYGTSGSQGPHLDSSPSLQSYSMQQAQPAHHNQQLQIEYPYNPPNAFGTQTPQNQSLTLASNGNYQHQQHYTNQVQQQGQGSLSGQNGAINNGFYNARVSSNSNQPFF